MQIYQHFLLSLIPGMVLLYFSKIGALVFVLVNVFIDADHYPVYIAKFNDFSLKRASDYFKSVKVCKDLALLHCVEVILLVGVISFVYPFLFFVFWGMVYHLGMDVYDAKSKDIRRYFFFTSWFRKEILKKIL